MTSLPAMWSRNRGWPAYVVIAGGTAALDLVTKSLLFARLGMPGTAPSIVLVPRILTLETNLNEGALFGMG